MHLVGASFGEDHAVVCLSQWTNTVRLSRVSRACGMFYRLEKENKNKESNRNTTHIFETTRRGQQARPFAEA
jgi:hypothetical protein